MDHRSPADPERIREYHAHVYYQPETRGTAKALRRELEARFPAVRLGRWHDTLVGPHTRSMYQVAFAPSEFARLVPWLMLNCGPLDVLVHPETGDDLADHQDHAMWLGDRLPLRLEALGGAD
jgi:aromatic ring-cleaving dioxygenase